jgi:hypothetical protein
VGLTLTFFARDVLIGAGTIALLRGVLISREPTPEQTGAVLTA